MQGLFPMNESNPKKPKRSRTLWVALATAVAGAVLSAVPEALPATATGPGLLLLAAVNAALRVVTTQPLGR